MKVSSSVASFHNFAFSPSLTYSNHQDQGHHVTLKPLLAKGTISWPRKVGCKSGIVVECGSRGMVRELERELEGEIDEEKGKGKSGMTRYREKCGGERKGAVELLECLEKEAIMGDDVGKEANDYNRRARIFDRSSRVFQALKEFDDHA
ncbi:uncharacterized protein LOC131617362 [Vicia villosa]|uniref:uncharacterized protein LOC131617362 n=1 Tax=Vicia villosa TaxID=3911 RepID=UPI00273C53EC|nr:uncharacterized protein LOC131617362 [Vicia villosa]